MGNQHSAPEPAGILRAAEGRKKPPISSAITKTNTVDITLKVKERGKNSIQLNGGVSGIAGSFVGFSYATNNFLGLGETLSLDRSWATASGT